MVAASAPGKVILLGEHAVVYGEPAIALAVGPRCRITAEPGDGPGHRVNGAPLSPHAHAHVKHAVDALWDGGPLELTLHSPIPSASGLGSSAAISVTAVACLLELQGKFSPEACARLAYETEWRVQGGRGSPTDTSVATHGSGVLVAAEPGPGLLWEVARGERRWALHHLDVPPLRLVVGSTGVRGRTSEQVAKVARFVRRTSFAREILDDLGACAREGLDALRREDAERLGALMDRAHNGLTILGVSTPELDRLCEVARRHAYGAKLTGSGGGGSMIALTDEPEACAAAIERRGGTAHVVEAGAEGVRIE